MPTVTGIECLATRHLDSGVLARHQRLVELRDLLREPLVGGDEEDDEDDAGEERDPDEPVQQVEGDADLQREAPELVEREADPDDAVDVGRHQVEHLAGRVAAERRRTRAENPPVDRRADGGADLQCHDPDGVVEVHVEHGCGQRAREEDAGVRVAVPRRRRRARRHVGDDAFQEERAGETEPVGDELHHADRVVLAAERAVQRD